MSPPISKDWWLAAALSSAAVPAAVAQTAQTTAPRAGVVTGVSTGALVTSNAQTLMVGNQVVPGQKFTTGPNGQLHLLFLDQSAVTLGPDSELVLETFQFDPTTRQGQIRLSLNKGMVRVVGGQISKTQPTVVSTPHGKLAIQGGITIAETDGQKTSGVFLFGQGMSATDNNGNTQTVTRAGFGTNFGSGQPPATPFRMPISELNSRLQRLETPSGGNPGNQQPGGAPPGQLLSTGNVPGGASNPGDTLANDRLKNVVDTNAGNNPSNTLRTILGSGDTPNQS